MSSHAYIAQRLRSFQAFRREQQGIEERFLTPEIGGGRTVAVLSTPTGETQPLGWVVCHSLALEQIYLQPYEVAAARHLSANGYPVLRFHGQGYGDSERPTGVITLESHVTDVLDAVRVLVDRTGAEQVGLIGARFGGASALQAAQRAAVSAVVAWDPVVDGARYLRSLSKLSAVADVTDGKAQTQRAAHGNAPEPEEANIEGFPVSEEVLDELRRFDLRQRVRSLRARCLIVQIARSSGHAKDLTALAETVRAAGGAADHELLNTARPNRFGAPRFRALADGTKVDSHEELSAELIGLTSDWIARSPRPADAKGIRT